MNKLSYFYVLLTRSASANLIEFEGAPDNVNIDTCNQNTLLFSNQLSGLNPGDTFLLPNSTYCFNGGIFAKNKNNITIKIDGTLWFQPDKKLWAKKDELDYVNALHFENFTNVVFTSSAIGTFEGNGQAWWGYAQYLVHNKHRPLLFTIYRSENLLFENLFFHNSPRFNFYASDVKNVEIRHCKIEARRSDVDWHDFYNIAAFNTDGFDISGENIWLHHCEIWNDDDTIAVKHADSSFIKTNCSQNMLFENIKASGVGLSIGSIGSNNNHKCVRNITFRHVEMHHPVKGIYIKSRPNDKGTGVITDVTYENITIISPTQWGIWIGPQQAYAPQFQGACPLGWPQSSNECPVPSRVEMKNFYLKDIRIIDPTGSPGVILGNVTNPIQNLTFDNVVVENPGGYPWGDRYYNCKNTYGQALGKTWPIPDCLEDYTHSETTSDSTKLLLAFHIVFLKIFG